MPRRAGPLNHRQSEFVKHFLLGCSGTESAIRAGYSKKWAATSARELMKNPIVKEAIAEHRKKVKEKTGFNLEAAMNEALDVLEFARSKGNAMAMAKATELRSKLSGLLVEKHDITVNLVSIDNALMLASNRVLPLLLEPRPPPVEAERPVEDVIDITPEGEKE